MAFHHHPQHDDSDSDPLLRECDFESFGASEGGSNGNEDSLNNDFNVPSTSFAFSLSTPPEVITRYLEESGTENLENQSYQNGWILSSSNNNPLPSGHLFDDPPSSILSPELSPYDYPAGPSGYQQPSNPPPDPLDSLNLLSPESIPSNSPYNSPQVTSTSSPSPQSPCLSCQSDPMLTHQSVVPSPNNLHDLLSEEDGGDDGEEENFVCPNYPLFEDSDDEEESDDDEDDKTDSEENHVEGEENVDNSQPGGGGVAIIRRRSKRARSVSKSWSPLRKHSRTRKPKPAEPDTKQYTIDAIVREATTDDGRHFVLVKWTGYTKPTWEPLGIFIPEDSHEMHRFHRHRQHFERWHRVHAANHFRKVIPVLRRLLSKARIRIRNLFEKHLATVTRNPATISQDQAFFLFTLDRFLRYDETTPEADQDDDDEDSDYSYDRSEMKLIAKVIRTIPPLPATIATATTTTASVN